MRCLFILDLVILFFVYFFSFLYDSVRCLFVLDLVILFYLFIFFLGREAHRCANGASIL